jgi:hypothetical protein
MNRKKNGNSDGNGLPENHRTLRFLAALVKGQARLAREVIHLRTDFGREITELRRGQTHLEREIVQMRADFNRGFRTLFKVAMDSHRDIQVLKGDVSTLKSDVSDLKVRMTRVEHRLDGNGQRPRPNGR